MTKSLKNITNNAKHDNNEYLETQVKENQGLIWSIAKRFLGRGYDADDLYQIGALGFIKAAKNFDPSYEVKLTTYAVPYILGELKRFIRDDGPIKVSRSIKDLNRKIIELKKEYMLKENQELTIR